MEHWLVRNAQTPRLREMLWDPLALAALNQPASHAAAPVFARVLAETFQADPSASAIALPLAPLSEMYAEPAREYIEGHGGEVRVGATATLDGNNGGRLCVKAGAERWTPAHVIAAVPWFALPDLFEADPPELSGLLHRARRMASSVLSGGRPSTA